MCVEHQHPLLPPHPNPPKQVCFLCIPSCSPATSAAVMAVAASLGQIIRSRSTRTTQKKNGERLRRDLLSFTENGAAAVSGSRETPANKPPPGVDSRSRIHSSGRLGLEATRNVLGATAAALAADPKTPSALSESMDHSLEGAITRLAGAAELGTEPLIYVRRSDVAEVVDAFVRHARAPGELSVASPVLARLTIMRRSRRRDVRSRRSPIFSPEFRVDEGKRPPSAGRTPSPICRSNGRRPAGASSASPSVRGVQITGGRTLFKENIGPARKETSQVVSNGISGATARALSPVNRVRGHEPAGGRIRGGRDSEPRRWHPTRSPPPTRSVSTSSGPSTPICRTPIALVRNVSAGAATSPAVSGRRSSSGNGEKITFIPISPRVTGKGAAFDDFWSSGLE